MQQFIINSLLVDMMTQIRVLSLYTDGKADIESEVGEIRRLYFVREFELRHEWFHIMVISILCTTSCNPILW